VTDVIGEKGNPADSTLATKMIERHVELFGMAPRESCFDGAFATGTNLSKIKALGLTDVAFTSVAKIKVEDMTSSKRVYRALRVFRAGHRRRDLAPQEGRAGERDTVRAR
jgi:IS5 family transposase